MINDITSTELYTKYETFIIITTLHGPEQPDRRLLFITTVTNPNANSFFLTLN